MINFKRDERKRSYCINVYLCVSSGQAKIKNRINYNKGKFKLYVIEISKMADLNHIKNNGYDSNIDMLYILSDSKIDKYFKKKPSLWQRAKKLYSEDACIEVLNKSLR